MKDTNKGGFYDLPKNESCTDVNHNPPSHLYIPPGKGYKHICPTCGKLTNLVPLQITF